MAQLSTTAGRQTHQVFTKDAVLGSLVALKLDEAMTAAKKVKPGARQAEVKELEQASRDLSHEGAAVVAATTTLPRTEEATAPEATVLCKLPGCCKVVRIPSWDNAFAQDATTTSTLVETASVPAQFWQILCWPARSHQPMVWTTTTTLPCSFSTTAGSLPS